MRDRDENTTERFRFRCGESLELERKPRARDVDLDTGRGMLHQEHLVLIRKCDGIRDPRNNSGVFELIGECSRREIGPRHCDVDIASQTGNASGDDRDPANDGRTALMRGHDLRNISQRADDSATQRLA